MDSRSVVSVNCRVATGVTEAVFSEIWWTGGLRGSSFRDLPERQVPEALNACLKLSRVQGFQATGRKRLAGE